MKMVRTPCPRCECRTEKQAEKGCEPHQGFDDDWTCPGEYMETKNGWFIAPKQPKKESKV